MLALVILGVVCLAINSAVFGYNLSYFYNEDNNFSGSRQTFPSS